MNKTGDLKRDYEAACNAYLKAFCEKHDYDFDDVSWIGGRVGESADIADCCVDLSVIRTDIDRDAPEDEFLKWYDYDLSIGMTGGHSMNYQSWLSGAPRKSETEIAWLTDKYLKTLEAEARAAELQQELKDAIKQGDF